MSRSDPKAGARQHTFLFADLAGFTALTETHGDDAAADLAASFAFRVGGWLKQVGGGDAKTIGDAVMVRTDAANSAVALGLTIVDELCREPGFPVVRVGMNTGPATPRLNDWFGSTVNLAARVSAAAAGGEVLLTEATRAAAGELQGVTLERLGPRRFRNLSEPVVVYRAHRATDDEREQLAIDPVCRMVVASDEAAGELRYGEETYLFCSLQCAQTFAADPTRYLDAGGPPQ